MKISKYIGALAVAGLIATGMNSAQADILPDTGTPTISGTGVYTYTYNVSVTNSQTINTGDYFTIYDFGGFLNVVSDPTNWVATTMLVSPTPVSVGGGVGTISPTDDPLGENVTFTYTGSTPIVGPQSLGAFVIDSNQGMTHTVAFVGQGTDTGTGLRNGNITNTLAPVVTPEPGTWAAFAFTGIGMMGLMLRARKSRGNMAS